MLDVTWLGKVRKNRKSATFCFYLFLFAFLLAIAAPKPSSKIVPGSGVRTIDAASYI
jgi:hypothetical protein